MDEFSRELDQLLVRAYRDVGRLEEEMLRSLNGMDLTIGALHLLEAVGEAKEKGILLCELAQHMALTPPTVTVAVNKLEQKGYVVKTRSQLDKRSVIVTLTKAGHRINAAHRYFHHQMIRNVVKLLSEQEREGMLHGIRTLNEFFQQAIGELSKDGTPSVQTGVESKKGVNE